MAKQWMPLSARAAALAATLLLAAAAAAAAEPPRFEVDALWPKPLPNNWILGQVSGVATDAQDHVWIIQRPRTLTDDEKGATLNPPLSKCCAPAPPVIEFDPDGNVVQAWGGPGQGYEWPENEHGIRVDAKGFVWVGGNGPNDGMVLKFTREGKFVMQVGHLGPSKGSNDPTQLGRPADVWIDAEANEAYIADGYGNHRIIVVDAETGAYKRHWGAYGKPPTDEKLGPYDPKALPAQQFRNPVHCVKIARDGLVYVCDRSNDRIQVFRKDGSFVAEWSYLKETLGSGSLWDLYLWPDKPQTFIVSADGQNNELRTLLRGDGTVLASIGRPGRQAGQFHWVHNIAIDSKGNLFTTEVDTGKRVQKFRHLGAVAKE